MPQSANQATNPPSKFLGLDVLRGAASLSVVAFHESEVLGAPWLMQSGALAVDLFFVMSGFVIAHAYDPKIESLGTYGFMRIRAIRFYPLYLLGLAIGTLYALITIWAGKSEASFTGIAIAIVAAFVFLPAPPSTIDARDSLSPLNGPGWSLIFEIWINVIYAALFRYLTTAVLMLAIVSAAVILTRYAYLGDPMGGWNWSNLPCGVARVCYSFPLGVIIYRHRDRLPIIRRHGWITILATTIFLMAPPSPFYNLVFITIVSPLVLICILNASFSHGFASYCATTSYCAYAIHFPFVALFIGMGHALGLGRQFGAGLGILVILVVAPVLDKFYDRPLRKRLLSLSADSQKFAESRKPLSHDR